MGQTPSSVEGPVLLSVEQSPQTPTGTRGENEHDHMIKVHITFPHGAGFRPLGLTNPALRCSISLAASRAWHQGPNKGGLCNTNARRYARCHSLIKSKDTLPTIAYTRTTMEIKMYMKTKLTYRESKIPGKMS